LVVKKCGKLFSEKFFKNKKPPPKQVGAGPQGEAEISK